jgi:hypothetical protein
VRRVANGRSAPRSSSGSPSKSALPIVARSQGANCGLSARGFFTAARGIDGLIAGLSQIRQFVRGVPG